MSDIDKKLDDCLKGKVHIESDIESECYANCRAVFDAPEFKDQLYSLLMDVIDTNRYDIVECEGKDITEYMNLHRILQLQKLNQIFGKVSR